MFGRGLTRLQPAYVEDVAEAIGRIMQRAETPSRIFEFGGPRVYSYKEFLRTVAHQADSRLSTKGLAKLALSRVAMLRSTINGPPGNMLDCPHWLPNWSLAM